MAGGLKSSYTTIERTLPTNFFRINIFFGSGGLGGLYPLPTPERANACRSRLHGGALAYSAPGCLDGSALLHAGKLRPFGKYVFWIDAEPAPVVGRKNPPAKQSAPRPSRGRLRFKKKFIRKYAEREKIRADAIERDATATNAPT